MTTCRLSCCAMLCSRLGADVDAAADVVAAVRILAGLKPMAVLERAFGLSLLHDSPAAHGVVRLSFCSAFLLARHSAVQ